MSEFTARNLAVIMSRLPKTAKRMFDDAAEAKLIHVAEAMVEHVNILASQWAYPFETGNAMESTAVAVYVDGVVKVFRTDARPDRLQQWGDPVQWYRGKEQLSLALSATAFQCAIGVHIVLFVSQPYAKWLNTKHPNWVGFFDDLANGMSFMVHDSFRTISEEMSIGNFKAKGHAGRHDTF